MEQNNNEAAVGGIVFDVGEERRRPANYIDSYRLIQMMRCGAEPYNVGDGWKVEEPDPNGLGQTLTLEESVIRQCRALGNTSLERTPRGMILRYIGVY